MRWPAPDFFNSHIRIDDQLWVGNTEVHVYSSQWYEHRHEQDPGYDNVILHVVWEHDCEVYRKDGDAIPTLELKSVIPEALLAQYQKLFSKERRWINCEDQIAQHDPLLWTQWMDRLFFERLEEKSKRIAYEQELSRNHWEALLFSMLCRNFGSVVNGTAFFSIAHSVDFSVVRKCKDQQELEALLLGQAGLLEDDKQDGYFQQLQQAYSYLKHKYSLSGDGVEKPSFFRLRPSNFPTIRLSQLAVLYAEKQHLFSRVMEASTLDDYYALLNVQAADYWRSHYNFQVSSRVSSRKLSKRFMDLIIINTLVPVKFCYALFTGKDISDELIDLMTSIDAEKNAILQKFNTLGVAGQNALQSQALLQLKQAYCDKNRCTQCAIGNAILKT